MKNPSRRALIIDPGDSRGSLAAARALAGAGWAVGVASPRANSFVSASRAVTWTHRVSAPSGDLETFLAELAGAIAERGYRLVFAGGDPEVMALTYARERIPTVVPYPAYATVRHLSDKVELADHAERVGIAAPRTVPADDRAEVEFPVVVKARERWSPVHTIPIETLRTTLVADRDELRRRLAEIRDCGAEPLIQVSTSGALVAYVVVLDRGGKVLAELQQRADGVWPPGAGVSTRAHAEPVNRELADAALRLLRESGWWGLAEMQFLVDRTGPPCLVDVNPRFYGSLALATAAGLNLPDCWARVALGWPTAQPDPRLPVRYQWMEGDVRRAWIERRGGLARDLFGCVAYAARATHSISNVRDPLPAVVHLGHLARRGLARVMTHGTSCSERVPRRRDRTLE